MPSPSDVFQRLKTVCVPLLAASQLSPTTIKNVLKLLDELLTILQDAKATNFVLTTNLITYTFYPLSNILRRNQSSDIPDQVLEKILLALSILCEDWWWDIEPAAWEQIFMLCGAILGGIEGKGKGKERDDETKEAAASCLFAILHERPEDSSTRDFGLTNDPQLRLVELQAYAQSSKFVPILGQTLDSILRTAESRHLPLQHLSLKLLALLIGLYAPDDLVPSVLPGITSTMAKVCLGTSRGKGWANGDAVSYALQVLQLAIIRSLGDDICVKEGAVTRIVNLEDFVSEKPTSPTPAARPYTTQRTQAWLKATSSQVLIAINSLTPIVSHPTPSALLGLARFSGAVLKETTLTLPQLQPLLLHSLLSLSISDFPSVASEARSILLDLLAKPSAAQHTLNQVLITTTGENLSALPRLLPTHSDSKVEHIAKIIQAVCNLVPSTADTRAGLSSVSAGIAKLLGPTGGIEKWGWSLLSVLELIEPAITVTQTSAAQLMLENDPNAANWIPFPTLGFKHASSRSTQESLEKMFRALGRAAGDGCLFSVEWFMNVGLSGTRSNSVTALWCASRLLEGVTDISVLEGDVGDALKAKRSKRLMKLARSMTKSIAERWDDTSELHDQPIPNKTGTPQEVDTDANILVQHVKGLSQVHQNLRIIASTPIKQNTSNFQPTLHQALCLQLLAVSAGVLQAQFTPLLLYSLYPVLHSLVSPNTFLSSTAFALLSFITTATSYASPANLLLSNFDYALDAVSRRLTRRWLDVDATKVLALMVRLVGSDIVDRAGDVVEECFDRLDEFHGYSIIVEGLVEVLAEVINVVQETASIDPEDRPESSKKPEPGYAGKTIDDLFEWMTHRYDQPEEDTTNYGPAPRRAWGEGNKADSDDEEGDAQMKEGGEQDEEKKQTPIQVLTKQIVSRSLYFLTHDSPIIRARILTLLGSSASVLPGSAVLPSIHSAWPFILNRLGDSEFFVVTAAVGLVEALVTHFGSFMFRRIWDDVWPKFRILLKDLETADTMNALTRRGRTGVGTESAYTYSHRLYRSLIKTMAITVRDVHPHETSVWEVLLLFRRFLSESAHEELQECARHLYTEIGTYDPDVVWLALTSTMEDLDPKMAFLRQDKWAIDSNVFIIFQAIGI